MARIIDYEQDDERPFGVGKFKLDDGSEYYLDDAPRARDFLSQVEDESRDIASSTLPATKQQQYDNAVARLAQGPNAPQQQPGRLDPETFDPMKRAVSGPGGGEEEPLSSEPEPTASLASDDNMSHAPEEDDEEDAGGASTPSDQEVRNAQAIERVARAQSVVDQMPRTTRGVDPARMQREGVPVDKNVTRKGGVPVEVYNQQAQDRATAYDYTNDTLTRHQAEDDLRAEQQQEQLRAEILSARQINAKAELDLQRKETKYQADRQWLEQDVDSYYDKARPDPDRIFRERGVFGNIASAVAQFMGTYAAIISGSPNFANQILDKKIERDVDAQIEDFRRGKMKRDSQLARMAERGMTIEQMKAGLRLQQEKVLQKEAKAASLAEGTRESKQAYEALMAGRQEKFVQEENKFRTESLGETTVQADIVQPQAPKAVTPIERLKNVRDVLKLETEIGYEAGGGAPQERADVRSDKQAAAQAKTAKAGKDRVTDYGNRRAKLAPAANEAQKARDRLHEIREKYGHLPGVGTWDMLGPNTPLGEQRQRFLAAFGVDMAEAAGEVQQQLKIVEGAAVRANAGTQTEGDVSREAEAMRGPNQSEDQIIAGVERLTERAVTPLDDLDATYSDVLPQWREQQDQTLLDKQRKRREQQDRKNRGEEY